MMKEETKEVRLHAYLAHCDICSRRQAEELMRAGRVTVNGEVVRQPGTKIRSGVDVVTVDGARVRGEISHTYIALNKPTGVVSSCAQEGARTVRELIDVRIRLYPVGRLDKESDGLLLLTNDGELTARLTHPRYGHEKEYIVRVAHPLEDPIVEALREGVMLDGRLAQPAQVRAVSRHKLRILLREGRSRQIRRMCEAVGCIVTRLTRVRIENIGLDGMPPGGWRYLSSTELRELQRRVFPQRSRRKRT